MSHPSSYIASRSRPVAVALSVTGIEFVARICALSLAGVMGLGLFALMAI